MQLLNNFIELFMESAPWLMLGLFVAGLMKVLIPANFLSRHLGKPGFMSTIKAALLGAPLPLCSCGVIPAALGLRRNGASKAATTSFLIATPETGVDSISISYALLGPFMAIIRPIAAIASAITAGLLVEASSKDIPTDEASRSSEQQSASEQKCCKTGNVNTVKKQNFLIEGIKFSLFDLVDDIAKWLLIGLFMAAIIKTWVPNDFLIQWGSGLSAFLVMALIGVPMYICATASTPIAAGFLLSGVSPGAVLVFMLVGPATNIATIGVVKKELGKQVLYVYLGSVVVVGFVFGYLTNYLSTLWNMDFVAQAEQIHSMVDLRITYVTSIFLAVFMLISFYKSISKVYRP